jgi:hypothetical protein
MTLQHWEGWIFTQRRIRFGQPAPEKQATPFGHSSRHMLTTATQTRIWHIYLRTYRAKWARNTIYTGVPVDYYYNVK